MNKIVGLVAATFTPMNSDGTINYEVIPSMLKFLISQNIGYLYICGSTGEGPSLTFDERIRLMEVFKSNCSDDVKIIVNVGHNSLFEAKKLAKYAQELKVFAISAAVPTYYTVQSTDALVASMNYIAAGAPELPFYYYHIPHLTGAAVNMIDFLKMGSQTITNLAGIKYTASTLHEFMSCVNFENGKYDILFGSDEIMLAAMTMGARGFIGSTYNFAAEVYSKVIDCFNQGNLEKAKEYQEMAVKLVDIIFKYKGLPAQKMMMKIIGMDCGPVRLPLLDPEKKTLDLIRSEMESIGYFEFMEKLESPSTLK